MEDLEPSCSTAGINHCSYFHKAEFHQKRGTGHVGKIPESTIAVLLGCFLPLMNRERILSTTNNGEASTKDVIVHKDHFWNTDVVIKDVLAYICSQQNYTYALLARWAMWCLSHCPWKFLQFNLTFQLYSLPWLSILFHFAFSSRCSQSAGHHSPIICPFHYSNSHLFYQSLLSLSVAASLCGDWLAFCLAFGMWPQKAPSHL